MNQGSTAPRAGDAGPKRGIPAKAAAMMVFGALATVVGLSAWPVVRPAREVAVVQAVFDRSADESAGAGAAPRDQGGRAAPTVQAPGWLEAEPFVVACTALADGVVESIEVLEGEFVERGQVVARLVREDSELRLRGAEAELARARARHASAEAEQRAATEAWEDPVELERAVSSSRAASAEARAELAQLPALVEASRARLAELEEERTRVGRSSAQGASNEFELVVAEQRAAAQRAEVRALEARRGILSARVDRLESEQSAAERTLELRIEDRRRLATSEAGVADARASVARAEAARDEAALELERMVIRAPISGVVQRRLKAPGSKVVRTMDDPYSAHLVHLYDPKSLRVRVDVPLADAAHVSVGQRCEVVVEVLPDRTFAGEVLRTTHEADLQKNTLEIQVKVIDPDPMLRPEMLTRVKFLPRDTPGAPAGGMVGTSVLVPAAAVEGEGDAARVWVVGDRRNGRGVLAPRPVRILGHSADWVTVSGAVRAGDLIAVGLDAPRAGERVVIAGDASATEGDAS